MKFTIVIDSTDSRARLVEKTLRRRYWVNYPLYTERNHERVIEAYEIVTCFGYEEARWIVTRAMRKLLRVTGEYNNEVSVFTETGEPVEFKF